MVLAVAQVYIREMGEQGDYISCRVLGVAVGGKS